MKVSLEEGRLRVMICSIASQATGADLGLAGKKRFESWGLALAIYLILLFPFLE